MQNARPQASTRRRNLLTDAGEIGLPPLFPLRGFHGSTTDYIAELYAQYQRVVGENGLRLWGKPIVSSGLQGTDGRDKRFWHIITDVGRDSGPRRSLSLERCAWLPRGLWTLELLSADDSRCISWREGRKDLHVAPVDFSMHLVLREGSTLFRLVTGYPVDNADRAGRLMDRATAFWLSGRLVRSQRMTAPRLLPSAVA